MGRVQDKVAIVTGGSTGLGKATSLLLAAEGAKVVIADIQDDLGAAAAEEIKASGGSAHYFHMDVTSEENVEQVCADVFKSLGSIDILVNNAGINKLSSGQEVTDADLYETLQVNLAAPLWLIRALSPRMVENNYGRIINISSVWSVVSKQRRVTYSMSKAGLNALTRSLAVELAPHNVLVNAVAPGFVNTELTSQNNSLEEIEAISRLIPMGRLAEPAEIAELVFFLCSERNSYITGQTLLVDGGFSCT